MRWISRFLPVPSETLAIKPCFSFTFHQTRRYLQNRKRGERWLQSRTCDDLFNFSVEKILKTYVGKTLSNSEQTHAANFEKFYIWRERWFSEEESWRPSQQQCGSGSSSRSGQTLPAQPGHKLVLAKTTSPPKILCV